MKILVGLATDSLTRSDSGRQLSEAGREEKSLYSDHFEFLLAGGCWRSFRVVSFG